MGAGSEPISTPEEAWRKLRDGGRKLLINLESSELIKEKPVWLDEERWARAKLAIDKFRVGVSYSSFTGLLLILQLPEGLEPLLSTGNSRDIPALYQRYLATVVHVNSWYDDDVFDPETKGYKSIRQVRGMHKRVQGLMNTKFQVLDGEGRERKWMSQYDMALTQFAFIGLAMLWPEKSAMVAASVEELELINYYWRVLGWLMGIEDEYNMCQFDTYQQIKHFNRLVFDEEYKASFRQFPCPKGLQMTQAICLALHYYMPLVTFNNLAHWWAECFHFNGYEPQPMSAKEHLLHHWTKLSFNHLLKWEPFIRFSNRLHKSKFEQRLKNRDKVYEKLKAQYRDQHQYTFLSDRVDYFASNSGAKIAEGFEEAKLKPVDEVASAADDDNVKTNNNNTKLEDPNNNSGEQVLNGKLAGTCPFGYGATSPVAAV